MAIPLNTLNRLRSGRSVAAPVAATDADKRAFVEVIPQAPSPQDRPDAWVQREFSEVLLRDPSLISGFEIRYLEHLAKYNAEWSLDFDVVLADPTTCIMRVYVKAEDEIESALSPWLTDMTALRQPYDLDSSLVGSRIEYYLDHPEPASGKGTNL